MKFLFIDTETTGLEAHDRLVQVAYKVTGDGSGAFYNPTMQYFRPPLPISFEAMSVTHITNEMVEDKPMFADSEMKKDLASFQEAVLVAHNAPFDIGMLEKEGLNFPVYIDTKRVSQHLIDSPNHKLQYLRYSLDLSVQGTAHDAAGDVNVLVALFEHLEKLITEKDGCDRKHAWDKMVTLSNLPVLLRRFTFGKHINKTFEEVKKIDEGYLRWLYNSEMSKLAEEQNEDLVFTLKSYL